MKLIVIYGPPAVGKLTVANELSHKIGYKLFHNHLVVDLVLSVFPFGTTQFTDLNEKIKLMLIEAAAKNNVDLIITLVYGVETFEGSREDEFVRDIIDRVEKHHGEVKFVKLTCSKDEQNKRLVSESRQAFKKIIDPKILAEIEREIKLNEKIPFVNSLVIDNTDLSPEIVADKISEYLDGK